MNNRNGRLMSPHSTALDYWPHTYRQEHRETRTVAGDGANYVGIVERQSSERLWEDFERSVIMTKARQSLLLPHAVAEAVEREREARREREEVEEKAEEVSPAPAEVPPLSAGHDRNWHPVFDPEAIRRVADEARHFDRERKAQYTRWIERMARNDGRRLIRDLPAGLETLAEQFPNFAEAARVIEALAAVHRHVPKQLQSEALLLVGPPGIGKTYFIEAFAGMARVDLGPVSLGSAQGAFELTGTSQHWSNPYPGKVWQLLAEGDHANGILLLDEIDKAGGDERYRTSSALLDLLDSRTARRFGDQALNIEYDASVLWKIATANRLDSIPSPVLSRLHIIEIEPPNDKQLRQIYLAQWRELVANIPRPPELSRAVVRELVANRLPPRVTQRLLRIGLGRAIHERRRRVIVLSSKPQETTSRPIGFVHWVGSA